MITKYYSEKLNRYFNSADDCMAAEREFNKKEEKQKQLKEEKRKDAMRLEELKKAANDAYIEAENKISVFKEALQAFNNKYHEPFRTTLDNTDKILTKPSINLVEEFFKNMF